MTLGTAIVLLLGLQTPQNLTADEILDRLAEPSQSSFEGENSQTRSLRNIIPQARFVDLNIQFDFDSSTLTPTGKDTLKELVVALRSDRLADKRFLVEGHTDATGGVSYNLALSEKRALAVIAFLIEHGVQSDRLEGHGKGFFEPLNRENPFSAENRRVRVAALPK